MDEAVKEQFKWKFYQLAIILNFIVLLIAFAIIACFLAPSEYRILIMAVLIFIALLLSIFFSRQYRATKGWLDEH